MLENQNFNRSAAGSPAVAAAATSRDYYPNLANVLATLLAVFARPAQATQPGAGAVGTDRTWARGQLSMLLREFETQLDFDLQVWRDGIYALRLSQLLRRISPGAFRHGLLARDLEGQHDCAQVTAADAIPGTLARAVLARAQDPDDAELARVADRVVRRADQVDQLRQRVERGLSRLRRSVAPGARRARP